MKYIDELKTLNLPTNEYAVFGTGPMGIRGLKEINDLDIVVSALLWKELINKYEVKNDKVIKIGNIEIYKDWKPWFKNAEELIKKADVIDGIRFVKLDQVLEWKKQFNREKDQEDMEILEEYMKKEQSKMNIS